MATSTKTSSKPPADPVADAQAVLTNLEVQREKLAAERLKDDAELRRVSFAAHVLHEMESVRSLAEITRRGTERDAELRSLDCAILEANERLSAAQAAEVAAVNRQRAAEARKLVKELAECFPYLDRKLAEAANALTAINDGVAQLHAAGFQFPSDSQLRLGVAAILQTWAHRLPRSWHDQLRDGFEFLAPGRRQTAVGYWKAIEPSLQNAIGQRLGEAERTTEAA
jgi:hypothetical protein